MRQNNAGNQWLSAGRKTALKGKRCALTVCEKDQAFAALLNLTLSPSVSQPLHEVIAAAERGTSITVSDKIGKKTMVNAVSSQAATFNPLAYTALEGNDKSRQPASNATSSDSDRGPATQVSLSQDALDRLMAAFKQGPEAAQQAMDAWSQIGADLFLVDTKAAQRQGELAKINSQLTAFDLQDARQETNKAAIERLRKSYDKMLNSPISPEVTLNAAEAAKALQMLKDAGRTLPPLGPNASYGFVKDGIQYNFRGDGTVTTRKEGIATSVEDRQKSLAAKRAMMDIISNDIRDNSGARASLIAQRDALMGQ